MLEELDLPALVIGGPGQHGRLPSVWADDARAMTSVVEYLAGLGHRRIARVAGLPDLLHTERRTEAFRAAVASNWASTPAPVLMTDYTGEQGAAATRQLLVSPAAHRDRLRQRRDGRGRVAVAAEMGVAVPTSLSVVAWDDSPLCQLLHPPLTAVSLDVAAYGAEVARRLVDLAAGRPVESACYATAVLSPRGSTGPVPAS